MHKPTTALFVREIIAIDDSITAPDTQLTRVTEAELNEYARRVARRTVAFIAQVRTVKRAVTATSHVKTRTTSTAKLLVTAYCTHHTPSYHMHANGQKHTISGVGLVEFNVPLDT